MLVNILGAFFIGLAYAYFQKHMADGNYDCCLSYSKVMGTWRSLENAKPYIGKPLEISKEEELKVEVRVKTLNLEQTLKAIKDVHPYETPVINIIPLLNEE